MNEHGERLRAILSGLLSLERCGQESYLSILELALLLRTVAEADEDFVARKRVHQTTMLREGVAIGAWGASNCAEDQVRKARFPRGAVKVVREHLARNPGRPVHLLEAGCGPLATLAAPLAAYFEPGELQVTLVGYPRRVGRVCRGGDGGAGLAAGGGLTLPAAEGRPAAVAPRWPVIAR